MSAKMITRDDGKTIMRLHYARAGIFTKGAVEVSESSLTSSKRNGDVKDDLRYDFTMVTAAGNENNGVALFDHVDPVLLMSNMVIRAIDNHACASVNGEPEFINTIVGVVYRGMTPYRGKAEVTYIFPNELAFILPHIALAWKVFHSQEQSPTNVKLHSDGPYLHCEIDIPRSATAVYTYYNFGFLEDVNYFIDTPQNDVVKKMYAAAENAVAHANIRGYRLGITESMKKGDNTYETNEWKSLQKLILQISPQSNVNGEVNLYPHLDGDVRGIEHDVVFDASGPLITVATGYIFSWEEYAHADSLLTAFENGTNTQSRLLEAGCGCVSVLLDTIKINTLEEMKPQKVLLVKISYRHAYVLSMNMRQHYCGLTRMISISTFTAHIDDIISVSTGKDYEVKVVFKSGAVVDVHVLEGNELPFVQWINMLKGSV